MIALRLRTVSSIGLLLTWAVFTLLLVPAPANAQCPSGVIGWLVNRVTLFRERISKDKPGLREYGTYAGFLALIRVNVSLWNMTHSP